jgi:methylenetetrahydrofolate dehydrogenase (NADP+)/methenyltetrahydrofolate cyclohydrolase
MILVGDNPASLSYVRGKQKALAEVGMVGRDFHLPADTSEGAVLARIAALNADPTVHGLLVQLPLPAHIDPARVCAAVSPAKDVDGFLPVNIGRLVLSDTRAFAPCTAAGVVRLLEAAGVPIAGQHAVIVGRSNLVGRPLSVLLSRRDHNATVTVCHSATRDLGSHTRQGDILVVAAGHPGLITADMVKSGAVLVDVGMSRVEDPADPRGYRLVGDADFAACSGVAGWITPVPGGVGPMTIAMLLVNTLQAARSSAP